MENDTTQPPAARIDCAFPSKELRVYRQALARHIDDGFGQCDVTLGVRMIESINRLRLAHEELTGCGCWYTTEDRELHSRLEAEARSFKEAFSHEPEADRVAAH